MTIDKYPVWANSGTLEPDTTWDPKVSGGMSAERLRFDRLNRMVNRADSKINEHIDRGPKGVADDGGRVDFVTGVMSPEISAMSPADYASKIETGDTRTFDDMVTAVVAGSLKLLTVDQANDRIFVYDIDTLAQETILDTELLVGLDTSGTQDWAPLSCCADASFIYVLFIDYDSDEYWIQSYRLSDWAPNPSWPSVGTQMSARQVNHLDNTKIRNATTPVDGKLVVAQTWRYVTSGTSEGLAIVDKTDGSIDGYGAGDCLTHTNGRVLDLCSNGTYIFFAIGETSNITVCSMSIASPGANGGFYSSGQSIGLNQVYFGGIACCGESVVVTYNDYSVIYTLHNLNQQWTATFSTNNADKIQRLYDVCTDGLNFWARGDRNALGSANEIENMVYRLDGALFAGYSVQGSSTRESYSSGQDYVTGFKISQNEDNDSASSTTLVWHDGSDLWMSYNVGGHNSLIVKLQKTLLR
jgi:hypothetical protein